MHPARGRSTRAQPRLLVRVTVAVVAVVLSGSACATRSPGTNAGVPSQSPTTGAFPVSLRAANGTVLIASRPERVVSLSPTATEMLFAIGAGPQVVAVDDLSNYPPGAPVTKLSGFKPNAEAIATYDPDLVVLAFDPGSVVDSLRALKVPVLLEPAANALADTYSQLDQLGMATGHAGEAERVVASMRAQIEQIVASTPHYPKPPTYYHELDTNYFTATSKTFIGQIYALLGLRDIADRAPKSGSGYVQLSGEFIVQSDPQLIFLADTKGGRQSAATVAKRPGWDQITAVRDGAVVELDDDVASRWGPRVVDFLRLVAAKVQEFAGARV